MRTSEIERNTKETQIQLKLNIDGSGKSEINTGCGFLDHMLTLFAKHGRFDLQIVCHGDKHVDYHHTTEDVGICLGMAFAQALGDCRGITRYGNFAAPMDDALIFVALDISGRDYLRYSVSTRAKKVGDFDVELVEEFLLGFVRNAKITLHVKQIHGSNTHHILESAFKSFAVALRNAVRIDADFAAEIPSTKGVL